MPSSLEKLVKTLHPNQLVETQKFFASQDKFNLMCRKGVFPYEFVDSYEKLTEIKRLPEKKHFYNAYYEEDIGNEDYRHAQNVWSSFDCKDLGEYSDLYLKTDVLLLTDVFESFRKLFRSLYKIEACHFVTFPGLAWACMLKYSEVSYLLFYFLIKL